MKQKYLYIYIVVDMFLAIGAITKILGNHPGWQKGAAFMLIPLLLIHAVIIMRNK